MLGFEPEEAERLGAAGRYQKRVERFRQQGKPFPRTRHFCWWMVHNCVAHPLLLIPCSFSFWFHDWTSKKLNAK